MDVLADVLRSVRLNSKVFARYDLTAPWGLRMTSCASALFYAITEGTGALRIDDDEIALGTGDFVFIPSGREFDLRDSPGTKPVPLLEAYASRGAIRCGGVLCYGGGGAKATIVAGSFALDGTGLSPIAGSLPSLLHVKSEGGAAVRWLDETIRFLASEIASGQPGYETIVGRLADVLFVHALRAHMTDVGSARSGWLRALVDPRIGRVLAHVHERVDHPWTLAGLARVAGMSRTVFAEQFKQLVGEAPLTYVTRWRMHLASERMLQDDSSIGQIARAVGYETESAFGKAFKRHVGVTPGAFRRGERKASSPA